MRETLPSWLEHLPAWDPIVVCADDPEATEYAAGELMLAGRGCVVEITQGRYFNKFEALRAGCEIASWGQPPLGQIYRPDCAAMFAGEVDPTGDASRDVIAIFDADTVALRSTSQVLDRLGPEDGAISGSGHRDDMGLLICAVGVLRRAMRLIPVGEFPGYGPEDCALRIATWTILRRRYHRLAACWARRTHRDRLRTQNYPLKMSESLRRGGDSIQALIDRYIAPEDFNQMVSDAVQSMGAYGHPDGEPTCA